MKKHTIHIAISLIVFSSLLFLSGCNDETEVNMGQGYYYIPYQEVTFDVSMFSGNGIYVYKDQLPVPIIFPRIISYSYDSLYIIVKQKIDYKETQILIENMLFKPNVFKYDKSLVPLDKKYTLNDSQLISLKLEGEYVDSIMNEDSHIKKMIEHKENYYIIDKTKKEVIGPLAKSEFDEKREAMHLSDKLKLD